MKKWHLKQVPKTIYFYWGAPKMPFLRFMSIYSFRKYNPDWRIVLLKPVKLSNLTIWGDKQFEMHNSNFYDYSLFVDKLDVEVELFDFEKEMGISNGFNEVHKSDILRYYLLHSRGGVWSDMDILYFKEIIGISSNTALNEDKTAFVFSNNGTGIKGHAIGFLMGVKNNRFYKEVYDKCLISQTNAYQGYGPELLNRYFTLNDALIQEYFICNLSKNDVYAFDHDSRDVLFSYFDSGKYGNFINNEAIGVHWYGGSVCVKSLLLGVNHLNYLKYNNNGLITFLLRNYFEELGQVFS